MKNEKNWTKQKFDQEYNEYSEAKHSGPLPEYRISGTRTRILELGVGALPLIIDKIEKGDTNFIPVVAQLTNYTVKTDAETKEVLDWWKANKDKLTIFDYSDSQGN